MSRRLALALVLVSVCLAADVVAAPATQPTLATHRHAVTRAKGNAAAGAKTAKTADATRRISDVHIEGEMPVPQVLFITARDQRRYVDFQHQRYLRDSKTLGAATKVPDRVTTAPNDTHH